MGGLAVSLGVVAAYSEAEVGVRNKVQVVTLDPSSSSTWREEGGQNLRSGLHSSDWECNLIILDVTQPILLV